jgi:hypothetical protein
MAVNRFQRPLTVDRKITPFRLPTETIDESLAKQQENYSNVLKAQQDYGAEILALESRPGVEVDSEVIKNVYSDFDTKSLDYLSSLEGNFGSLDMRKLGTIANDTLLPIRETLTAMSANNENWKIRQDKIAKLGDRALDFDSSIDTQGTIDPITGKARVFTDGIEERLDWYRGMESLFKGVTDHTLIKEAYDPKRHGDDFNTWATGYYREMSSNTQLTGPDGMTIAGKIDSVVKNQIDEYIRSTEEGDQQYRWYKKQYYDREGNDLLASGRSKEDVEDLAHDDAVTRIQAHITDIGDKFKTRREVEKQLITDVRQKPQPKTTKSSEEGDDLEIVTNMAMEEDMTATGSKFNTAGAFDAAMSEFSRDYTPSVHDAMDYSELRSLDAIEQRLIAVGPPTNDYWNPQFKDQGERSRGELQVIEETTNGRPLATPDDPFKEGTDRTVSYIDARDAGMVDRYRQYIKDNYSKKNADRLLAQFEKGINAGVSPAFATIELDEGQDGYVGFKVNGFIEAELEADPDNPYFLKMQERAQEFMSQNRQVLNEKLNVRSTAQNQHRALRERHKNYLAAARMNQEDFEAKRNLLDSTQSKFTEAKLTTNLTYLRLAGMEMDVLRDVSRSKNTDVVSQAITDMMKSFQGKGEDYYQAALESQSGYLDHETLSYLSGLEKKDLITFDLLDLDQAMRSAARLDNDRIIEINKQIDEETFELMSDVDPQMANYVKAVSQGGEEWIYQGLTWMFPAESPEHERLKKNVTKFVMNTITTKNNNLFKANYNLDTGDASMTNPMEQKSYTLYEAIKEAALLHNKGDEIEGLSEVDNITDLMKLEGVKDNVSMSSLTFDNQDGLVVRVNIFGTAFEVRDIPTLPNYLVQHGNFPQYLLDKTTQAASTLKQNDFNMGYIGEGNEARRTTFYVSSAKVDGFDKGHYYIYENGNPKRFENVYKLIDWHMENKENAFKTFTEAGTPLAMSDQEWKEAMPGVSKEVYRARYAELWDEHIAELTMSDLMEATGYTQDELMLSNPYGDGDDVYLKHVSKDALSSDDQKIFNDSDYSAGTVSYTIKSETEYTNIREKYGRDIIAVGPVMRALDELDSAVDFPVVVTHSLRSLYKQKHIYDRGTSSGYKKRQPSGHMQGLSVDLRTEGPDGDKLYQWLQTDEGINWLRTNNLRAYIHKLEKGAYHADISLNIDYNRKKDYVLRDDKTSKIIK